MKIVTSCEQIEYKFQSFDLDDCFSDRLTFQYNGNTVSFCKQSDGYLKDQVKM